jgi:homoaconitase/3-isopropylmalate dehydratase large subunit
MTASESESFTFTLRGFSPRELGAQAERECRKHFGECAWKIEESTCAPCMGTLGGRVRLYEARVVATGDTPEHP